MKFDICVPILGFENVKQVTLEKIDDVFMKMQSVDDKYISFTLINPFVLREYDFEVPDNTQELLGIDKDSNIIVQNIVLIQTPIEDSVINFIGPMIFNTNNNKAAQVILSETTKYGVAEKISTFLKK
ncbi:MAG: flagellar biosynthesis protein FliW [Sulfurimonas sp. RIFCSPLOWO2_12_36_12]|uniref:flagellar assembly protein FliW n=1 Tax=Sulfurimonas sp. RIFCSPLOWO2_12_36_12 TaxID=1802253 RepID=UPI0008AB903F|nr:flagellar assembly protein FliW [Sulfurimonas sp. RIFCSPLOWO2_12_36_12]OHE02958.1 MAG: flagellar biosynthesis protein FliW [Sulfurimonas sp. RIFCSPLOWO2_12_36_12]